MVAKLANALKGINSNAKMLVSAFQHLVVYTSSLSLDCTLMHYHFFEFSHSN